MEDDQLYENYKNQVIEFLEGTDTFDHFFCFNQILFSNYLYALCQCIELDLSKDIKYIIYKHQTISRTGETPTTDRWKRIIDTLNEGIKKYRTKSNESDI